VHGFVREWGDWPPIMVAAAIGYIIARVRRNNRWSRIILAAMAASTLAGIIANASRLTTGRTRPRESPKIEQGFYGPWHEGRLLVGVPTYNSFPSGHTATAFGFAFAILYAAPGWGILAVAGAAAVAWSSIAIGAHHPSDIFVSTTLASIVGWFVWRISGRPPPRRD
jgi:membrane-associated phospholipid phosphatase